MQFPYIHLGRQPGNGIPRLNTSHPLAKGLVAAYYPGAFPPSAIPNLASPGAGDLTTNGGGAKLGPTHEGFGLALTGTATNIFVRAVAPPTFFLNGFFSLFVRGLWTGEATPNVPAPIFGLTYDTTGASAPFYSYLISPSSGTQGPVLSAGFANSGGFIYETFQSGTQPTLVTNTMASGGVAYPLSPSVTFNYYNFQNGIGNVSGNTHSGGVGQGATPWITMGDPSGRGRNVAFTLTAAYIWNWTLMNGDFKYMDTNPYSLFLWPSDYIRAELVGIIPTLPISNPSSPILSPLTVGLGAASRAGTILRRNPLLSRRNTMFGRWEK